MINFSQKQLKESEYGTDMQTVKIEYERHQKEHKVIDQFQGNVEKCREAEVNQVFCIYIIYVFSLSLSLSLSH